MPGSTYADAVRRAQANSALAVANYHGDKAGPIEAAIVGEGTGGGLATLMGGGKTEKQGKLYDEFKHWIYVAISAIATRIAGQPFGAGQLTGQTKAGRPIIDIGTKGWKHRLDQLDEPTRTMHVTRWCRTQNRWPTCIKEMTQGGQQIEPFFDHDILDFLKAPNEVQGKFEFLFCIIANLLITGESYIIAEEVKGKKKGDDSKRAQYGVAVWAVPTPWITAKHENGELFSSYELKPSSQSEPVPLPKEAVCRLYIPDPKDPKSCISPLATQMPAVKIDGSIQHSQQAMFEKGIFPNVALTIGKNVGPDGTTTTGVRPVLSGAQRAQLVRAVRQLWKSSVANGDPAILDGLTESIHKLSNTPAEMDWMQSSEAVKKRIFQAFKVNPYVCGEITNGNRAQAAVADQSFCDQAVNPLIEAITSKVLEWLTTLFDESDTLVLWLEKATPKDEELALRKWQMGLAGNAVTKNEFRGEVMGLPPMPDEAADKPALLGTVGGMTGTVAVLQAVGQGYIAPDSAAAMLKLFFSLDDAAAQEIVGSTGGLGELAVQAQVQKPDGAPRPGQPDDEQDDEEPPDDEGEEASGQGAFPTKPKGGLPAISRSAVKAARRGQQGKIEQGVAKKLHPFFPHSSGRQLLALLSSLVGP